MSLNLKFHHFKHSDPTDTDYKSNESPYQSNEVLYPSPPGPPAPPIRSYDSFRFQPSKKSIYSADNNYEVRLKILFLMKVN